DKSPDSSLAQPHEEVVNEIDSHVWTSVIYEHVVPIIRARYCVGESRKWVIIHGGRERIGGRKGSNGLQTGGK
ncbi:hypothetical protein LINPERPRIM_LOCUS4151, partial [Linum perenne]